MKDDKDLPIQYWDEQAKEELENAPAWWEIGAALIVMVFVILLLTVANWEWV